ncbi:MULTISPECIES: 23S rRNA (guanosine(2251)-2'-O)-methyltransferase RlmB [Nitrospirillum]|uniref:23S rRNA (Guanosine2251-2'-O)-methyltransferase n=1 Tax=Nitrospirillum amazonense TaxID=28077 RepID=A0A560EWC5_9PROT|nr:23S rRNA (guanosine(2251)-2'-O)-methyltransferase RlmB [Nitrospirillum amazonense]MEC4594835.1 23S rRNA (guanosine(2251)-2'-O)-methyltransferase RlmB [Nitrospirillum amazonense]TWB13633.1 23S rRNA (guanosine2251-2'-O)-methyltransferase [Nitrospirillum amazonense]
MKRSGFSNQGGSRAGGNGPSSPNSPRPPRDGGRPGASTPRVQGTRVQGAHAPGERPRAQDGRADGAKKATAPKATPKPGMLYGQHPVVAAWTNPERRCKALLATPAGLELMAEAFAQAKAAGLARPEPTVVEREALDRLLPTGAVHQGLVLDASPLPELDIADVARACGETDMVVVLDQVTDPHNVGAILRSAAAFGAKAVIVQDRHAPEVTGVLAKTASGALEVVPLVRVTNLSRALTELQDGGFFCVGLAESGPKPLHALDFPGRVAVVMGSEGDGLRRLTMERCDALAHLPTQPPIGSLNVSNAAAVALYEVARRR